MGTFDPHADRPEQIRIEGEQITLRFDRTGPTTARVSWNIPTPANGCTAETQAYAGIVVTLDTVAASLSTAPSDGTVYTADPTGDGDLFAGDEIGTAMVVGAFYECVKKGSGEELTTFFDITGLDANTAYYVSGYAVDCQNRYHRQGVFAYSQNLESEGTADTSGYQIVKLCPDDGVSLSDGTGLSLDTDYTVRLEVDGSTYTLTVNGDDTQTYKELIDELNVEFQQLTPAPTSPVPPNTGAYYYTDGKLYQWDGTTLTEIPVLNEPTDPTALAVGDYWYDVDDEVLNRWDGSTWVAVDSGLILTYNKDITDTDGLTSADYWYRSGSPSAAYNWCGNVWCEQTLYDQETDPVAGVTPMCGSYWYNPDDMLLRAWEGDGDCSTGSWVATDAIYWDTDPSAISAGVFWFDDVTAGSPPPASALYVREGVSPSFWRPAALGYQDVFLSATHDLDDLALADGTYTETINVNGDTITLTVEICNATEGRFDNVFAAINEQLNGEATVAFREGTSDAVITLTGSGAGAPEIQAGGDLFSSITDWSSNGMATSGTPITIGAEPETPIAGQYWVDLTNEKVFLRNVGNTAWERQCSIFFGVDPTDRISCDLWWNSDTDVLSVWDDVNNTWVAVESFIQSTTDPVADNVLEVGVLWYQPSTEALTKWDGSEWVAVNFISHATNPVVTPAVQTVWMNPDTSVWQYWDGSQWVMFDPVNSNTNPSQPTLPTGTFWYDTMNNVLYQWNGTNWISIIFSTTSPEPSVGDYWFDTSEETLKEWDGSAWVAATPVAFAGLTTAGYLMFGSNSAGSDSKIVIDEDTQYTLLRSLTCFSTIEEPVCGTDGLEGKQSYAVEGVGTDGSSDERREVEAVVRERLGHPVVTVELTKEQMNHATNIALRELRRRSSAGYRRGFMTLPIKAGKQRYVLTKKTGGYQRPDGSWVGYDHIAQVMGVFRTTAAFMTSAHGSGIFGQVVLQHLYNMGTFDLLSFHLVSEYIEQLEHLFSSRMAFSWNETDRTLWLHQVFSHNESALMDVAVERTEQDLLSDRFTRQWLEDWTLMESMKMLSQIRGKYATLPGAGGGVSLNAADLMTQADQMKEDLIMQIDNYQVNNVEEYGWNAEFIIG